MGNIFRQGVLSEVKRRMHEMMHEMEISIRRMLKWFGHVSKRGVGILAHEVVLGLAGHS